MTLDAYLDTLGERDDVLFTGVHYRFWVDLVCDLAESISPDTEETLTQIVQTLRSYYHTGTGEDAVKAIRKAIVATRGPGFWRDFSLLGTKYRCIWAIATTVEENEKDTNDWVYAISVVMMHLEGRLPDEQAVIERIAAYFAGNGVVLNC